MKRHRDRCKFRPAVERVEGRVLLSPIAPPSPRPATRSVEARAGHPPEHRRGGRGGATITVWRPGHPALRRHVSHLPARTDAWWDLRP